MPALNPYNIMSIFGWGNSPEDQRVKDAQKQVEQAENAYRANIQDMFNQRRQQLEQGRTDSVKMAKFNALGNALRTLVQPIGWGIGRSTAGVQPYDNRAYIDAFNRAVKASDDIRNVGMQEMEANLGLDAQKVGEARRELQAAKQAEINAEVMRQRHENTMSEIEARGDVQKEIAEAKARYRLTMGGKKVSDSVKDVFYKRAASAYNNYKADYLKKQAVGIEMKQPLLSFDAFVRGFASNEGFNVEDGGGSTAPASTTEDYSGYKRGASSGGDDYSQYKRK